MQILQSWKESLLIFKPSHFKLFFLITIKSIWETYKLLFRYFWWLLLSLLLLHASTAFIIFFAYLFTHGTPRIGLFWIYLFTILSFFSEIVFFYIIIIIARPSVAQKRWPYFRNYLFSWYSLFSIFSFFLIFYLLFIFLFSQEEKIWSLIWTWFLLFNLFVFFIFFVLFFLDTSPASLRTIVISISRTIKMIIYNYPFLFAIFFILYMSLYFCEKPIFPVLLYFLFMPVLICILTNFYIKRVHEQFDLYFEKGSSE